VPTSGLVQLLAGAKLEMSRIAKIWVDEQKPTFETE